MVWPSEVVGEEKLDDWSTGSSRQKSHRALEKFEGEFYFGQKPALEQHVEFSRLREKSLTRKKERKKSENWKPVKDEYNSNRFPSTILKYWKVVCIQKREKL